MQRVIKQYVHRDDCNSFGASHKFFNLASNPGWLINPPYSGQEIKTLFILDLSNLWLSVKPTAICQHQKLQGQPKLLQYSVLLHSSKPN